MKDERELKVDEIEAKRINIVDENGTRRLAVFNGQSMPVAMLDGEPLEGRNGDNGGVAGFIFFNQEGDECGGLIYGNQGAALMFDQHKQDQIIGIMYDEEKEKRKYGLYMWDRPELNLRENMKQVLPVMNMEKGEERNREIQRLQEQGLLGHQRLFAGRGSDGEVSVTLADKHGTERIRMLVDKDDNPYIEFLNSRGEVVYKLPPDGINMD